MGPCSTHRQHPSWASGTGLPLVIPGAVLSGGRSTRMGRDKATTPVDGVPMATRTALTLRQAGCVDVRLVGRSSDLQLLGFPVIEEPEKEHHPLFGVAAVISSISPRDTFKPCWRSKGPASPYAMGRFTHCWQYCQPACTNKRNSWPRRAPLQERLSMACSTSHCLFLTSSMPTHPQI